jgi:hypothetical protein
MGGGGKDHDRALPDFQSPDSMNGQSLDHRKLLHRFRYDSLTLLLREDGMMGVVEFFNITAFVVIADQTLEYHKGTAGRVSHLLSERSDIKRSISNREHGFYPPAKGGINAMV